MLSALPQELVDHISSYLGRKDLKHTLLISPKFQRAAEEYSGAFKEYALTEENIDKFVETFSSRSFRHLRRVKFRTSVPGLGDEEIDEDNPCRDTADQLNQMDHEFTRQINLLFLTLQKVEKQAGSLYGPGRIELKIYTPTRDVDSNHYCLHRVFTSWRIHLLSPETLPSLTSVQSLLVKNGSDLGEDLPTPALRKLDLRVLLDISAKLPNLRTLRCKIGSDEWIPNASANAANDVRYTVQDWPGPRRDARHDFSKALGDTTLSTLRHAQLDFIYPLYKAEGIDQRLAMPDLTKPALYDPFSSSLRLLSYQLRTLKLRVVADETLFWPADNSVPSWPNLENLSVMFHMATPSGSWYFKGLYDIIGEDEGFEITEKSYPPMATTEEDEESDYEFDWDSDWERNVVVVQHRLSPIEKTLVPFLAAFAKAAALMPALKYVALWSPLTFDVVSPLGNDDFSTIDMPEVTRNDMAWGVAYVKPGTEAFDTYPGENFSAVRQLWWRVGRWRPESELLDLFHQIGRQEHGEPLAEYWVCPNVDFGLADRDDFTWWEDHISNC
jgi:hypothetical protein